MSNLKALVVGLGRPSGTTLGALNAHPCEKLKAPELYGPFFLNLWLWYSFTRVQPIEMTYNESLANHLGASAMVHTSLLSWWKHIHDHYMVQQVESEFVPQEGFAGWQLARVIPLAELGKDSSFQNDARSQWRAAALFGSEDLGASFDVILRTQDWYGKDFAEVFMQHWTENR